MYILIYFYTLENFPQTVGNTSESPQTVRHTSESLPSTIIFIHSNLLLLLLQAVVICSGRGVDNVNNYFFKLCYQVPGYK